MSVRPHPLLLAGLLLAVATAHAHAVEYRVILLGGQSNMDGRAATSGLPASLKSPQSNVRYWNGYSGSNGYTSGTLSSLAPGSTQFGPEVTFGKTMADANPAAQYALIKYAVGGTNLYSDWKAPTSGSPSTGSVYAAFKSSVNAGLNSITSGGDSYRIVGMLWLQGESDTSTSGGASSPAALYQTNLSNFIADVRTNYGANLPFVIGGIGYSGAGTSTIASAQAAIADADPYTSYFSNTDILPSPSALHFDAAGQQVIGQRFAGELQAIPEPGPAMLLLLAGGWGLLVGRRAKGRRP